MKMINSHRNIWYCAGRPKVIDHIFKLFASIPRELIEILNISYRNCVSKVWQNWIHLCLYLIFGLVTHSDVVISQPYAPSEVFQSCIALKLKYQIWHIEKNSGYSLWMEPLQFVKAPGHLWFLGSWIKIASFLYFMNGIPFISVVVCNISQFKILCDISPQISYILLAMGLTCPLE